ncbi:1,4-dihydroxy-2-naphthoyl-CoA thioesterase 1 [Camellia lanceoleosa]|uniref:1,4-dihydroxy-2-naphthoyl-CoA thioesterase 1 n=1 Tax=Camellia lanceoleosa TaxID=1840588 RepID=A0ACC0G682_9ERIC|nr:1,4-dihydroxy-2-naphthoyl-CoA thioesterase 1 [Camellia lanceoleosa]
MRVTLHPNYNESGGAELCINSLSQIPSSFEIILRGKDVEHHNVVNDMTMAREITYRLTGLVLDHFLFDFVVMSYSSNLAWEVQLYKVDPSNLERRYLISSSRVTLLSNIPVPENAKDLFENLKKFAKL